MAKLRPEPITQADLTDYIETQSDFSFEMQTLHHLMGLEFECAHGGTYDDPVSKKPREFDIRASKTYDGRVLRLAVECKNLRDNYPLLLTCVPRRIEEAFCDIVLSADPEKTDLLTHDQKNGPFSPIDLRRSITFRLTGSYSRYRVGDPVAKSCEQVGRKSPTETTSDQSGIYEKWAQALSSADELTYLACTEADRIGDHAFGIVVPVVVVPDERLWTVEFDETGHQTSEPTLADRCTYLVNRCYTQTIMPSHDNYTISHLEFVTQRGLDALINELTGSDWEDAFPIEHIRSNLYPRHFDE